MFNSPFSRCSAMATKDGLSWVEVFGGCPLLDREGVKWTSMDPLTPKIWDAPSPLPQGIWAMHSTAPSLSTPQRFPLSTAWSQAEQMNTQASFSLLTLPRYQTCWQRVSTQKMKRKKKKVLLAGAPPRKCQGRSRWIDI